MGNLMNLAVHNPAILSDADFITGFVARRDLAENLLGRLREITPTGLARHHLILGQRGMGKTSLLRRLALGVRDDPKLAEVLLPLTFREEQYNVHNLHTFWMNCLDALCVWLEKSGQPEQADALDREVAALAQAAPDGDDALEAFKRWSKVVGRRPLLLLDNIDLILGGLADQDWSLRRVLQEAGGIVVVGTTAGYLEATADPKAAFYDFFQVSVLERLSQNELLAGLRRLAEARGEAGRRVREVIARDPGHIRTLYDLTGGNPRTLVLLYLVLERDADGDVMSDLERLLDQVTVLYKARVEGLAPQARVVLDALALNWNPATAADVARLTGLDTPAASTQLNRLQKAGIVEKVSISTSKRAAFQLGERLFNIWYLMRHGPRRQRTRLRWLTGFLKGLYSPEQLRNRSEGMSDLADRPALGEAVAEPGLRYLPSQSAREGLERYAAANGKRLEDLKEAEAAFQMALSLEPEDLAGLSNLLALHLIQPSRHAEAEAAFEDIVSRHPPHGAGLLSAIRALARDNFGDASDLLKVVFSSDVRSVFDDYQGFVLLILRLAARRGMGDKLLAWLDDQGLSDRYWPLRAAFDAYLHGEEHLLDVNPEVRGAAKRIYDLLDAPRRVTEAGTSRH